MWPALDQCSKPRPTSHLPAGAFRTNGPSVGAGRPGWARFRKSLFCPLSSVPVHQGLGCSHQSQPGIQHAPTKVVLGFASCSPVTPATVLLAATSGHVTAERQPAVVSMANPKPSLKRVPERLTHAWVM